MKVTLNICLAPKRPIFYLFKILGDKYNFVFYKLQNFISHSDIAPKHSYLVI